MSERIVGRRAVPTGEARRLREEFIAIVSDRARVRLIIELPEGE